MPLISKQLNWIKINLYQLRHTEKNGCVILGNMLMSLLIINVRN